MVVKPSVNVRFPTACSEHGVAYRTEVSAVLPSKRASGVGEVSAEGIKRGPARKERLEGRFPAGNRWYLTHLVTVMSSAF